MQNTVGEKGLNCLINNAGVLKTGENSINDVTAESMRSIYEVNTVGPAMVIKVLYFMPHRQHLFKKEIILKLV